MAITGKGLQQTESKTTNPSVASNGTAGSNQINTSGSEADATIFNPNLNTPFAKGATPTVTANNADIAPSEISQAAAYVRDALMNDFTNKTLYQDAFVISAPEVEEFVSKCGFKQPEVITGKYKEFGIVLPQIGTNYDLNAWYPSRSNVGSATGTVDVRKDIHKQWTNKFRVALIDADIDSNMIVKRLDIQKELYTEKFVSGKLDEFINLAKAQLSSAQNLTLANDFLFGKEAMIEGVTKTCNGLAQVIQKAKLDTQVGLTSANLTRNVKYTRIIAAGKDSKPEAISQLNVLIKKMKSPNQTFGFFNDVQTGATKNNGIPTQVKESNLILVMNQVLAESLSAAELNYFKEFKSIFPNIEIAVIPYSTLDTKYVADATQVVAPIKDINLGLGNDQIAIIDKSAWYSLTSGPAYDVETQYYPNNRTLSTWVYSKPTFGYLPNGSIAIYTAPILLSNFSLDVNVTNIADTPTS